MIGNAIDKNLINIGRSDCHTSDDLNSILEPMNSSNSTLYNKEECNQLKVEMAITLAFLTGIIMVIHIYLINQLILAIM